MRRRFIRIAEKTLITTAVLLLSMSATVIVLYNFMPRYHATPAGAVTELAIPQTAAIVHDAVPSIPVAAPTHLNISKINVDTAVNHVGITAEDNMDIDEDPKTAAWYQLGPKPGEEGSAVIAGHYGWKRGVASVFNELNKLVAGDEVSVLGEDGKVIRFTVTRLASYTPEQDATDVFRSDDGKAHLNLVTCQGSWNNSVQTYSERLVVFTDQVVQ
ncbi:MAG: peptidase family protein [Candidatus Saccharibacteria bacterium]|nr:peptidase family protein [Candidatus Saccharibacteria bacterium]MDB5181214.1 peptidase family protein [Candidatus Saccharibacteria bacterium]